jgi:hypothetical protein
MTPRSITPAEARDILGYGVSKFNRIRHQLRPYRDGERGHRRYDLADVLAFRERNRERQVVVGEFVNREVREMFS